MSVQFLGEDQVKLPVGGDFVPSGIIGAWHAKVTYAFYTKAELPAEMKPFSKRKMGDGYRLYFATAEEAKTAGEECGEQYGAQEVWLWRADHKHILNFANSEDLAKFSNPMAFDCAIRSLQSAKQRHELHLIALPLAVNAMAKMLGYDTPGFDIGELLGQGVVFDDALQVKMIGSRFDPSADKRKQYALVGDGDCELLRRKAALWNALGEPNVNAHRIIGAGTKYDTTSKKLSECLKILGVNWKTSLWCRTIQVPDPRVDATFGDENKRLSVPALYEIFESEKAAREVATKELAERAERKAQSNGHNATAAIPVPEQWAELKDDWVKTVTGLKTEYKGKSEPLIRKALSTRTEELAATVDEIMQWMKA